MFSSASCLVFSSSCFVTVVLGGWEGGWRDLYFWCSIWQEWFVKDLSFPQMTRSTSVIRICKACLYASSSSFLSFFFFFSCVLFFLFFSHIFNFWLSGFTFEEGLQIWKREKERKERMQNYGMLVNMLFSSWASHNLEVLVNSRYLLICWYSSLSPKCVWSGKA